jgi:hypothetical protein
MNREADSSPSREPGGTLSSLIRNRTRAAETKATPAPGPDEGQCQDLNLIDAPSCPASENNPVVGQSVRDFFTAKLRRVGVAVISQVRPCTAPRSRSSALGSLRHQIQSTDRWSVCQN